MVDPVPRQHVLREKKLRMEPLVLVVARAMVEVPAVEKVAKSGQNVASITIRDQNVPTFHLMSESPRFRGVFPYVNLLIRDEPEFCECCFISCFIFCSRR